MPFSLQICLKIGAILPRWRENKFVGHFENP
jgi:hypothetical protein